MAWRENNWRHWRDERDFCLEHWEEIIDEYYNREIAKNAVHQYNKLADRDDTWFRPSTALTSLYLAIYIYVYNEYHVKLEPNEHMEVFENFVEEVDDGDNFNAALGRYIEPLVEQLKEEQAARERAEEKQREREKWRAEYRAEEERKQREREEQRRREKEEYEKTPRGAFLKKLGEAVYLLQRENEDNVRKWRDADKTLKAELENRLRSTLPATDVLRKELKEKEETLHKAEQEHDEYVSNEDTLRKKLRTERGYSGNYAKDDYSDAALQNAIINEKIIFEVQKRHNDLAIAVRLAEVHHEYAKKMLEKAEARDVKDQKEREEAERKAHAEAERQRDLVEQVSALIQQLTAQHEQKIQQITAESKSELDQLRRDCEALLSSTERNQKEFDKLMWSEEDIAKVEGQTQKYIRDYKERADYNEKWLHLPDELKQLSVEAALSKTKNNVEYYFDNMESLLNANLLLEEYSLRREYSKKLEVKYNELRSAEIRREYEAKEKAEEEARLRAEQERKDNDAYEMNRRNNSARWAEKKQIAEYCAKKLAEVKAELEAKVGSTPRNIETAQHNLGEAERALDDAESKRDDAFNKRFAEKDMSSLNDLHGAEYYTQLEKYEAEEHQLELCYLKAGLQRDIAKLHRDFASEELTRVQSEVYLENQKETANTADQLKSLENETLRDVKDIVTNQAETASNLENLAAQAKALVPDNIVEMPKVEEVKQPVEEVKQEPAPTVEVKQEPIEEVKSEPVPVEGVKQEPAPAPVKEAKTPPAEEITPEPVADEAQIAYDDTAYTEGKDVADEARRRMGNEGFTQVAWLGHVDKIKQERKSGAKVIQFPNKTEEAPASKPQPQPQRRSDKKVDLTDLSIDALQRYKALSISPDPDEQLRDMIREVHNTSAVNLMDLREKLEANPSFDINRYGKPIHTIGALLDSPEVTAAIKECAAQWENNEDARNYIHNFFRSKDIPEDQFEFQYQNLLKQTGKALMRLDAEDSPDLYKAWVTVRTMEAKKDDPDMNNKIFQDEDDSVEFFSKVSEKRENNSPTDSAVAAASTETVEAMPEEKRNKLFGAAGHVAGKVVSVKYKLSDDFDSAMRNAMGEYADKYDDYKEKAEERKEERRREKEEEKQIRAEERKEERKIEREERRMDRQAKQQQKAMYGNQRGYGYGNGYGNSRYNDPRYGYGRQNGFGRSRGMGMGMNAGGYGNNRYAPNVPLWIVGPLINIIAIIVLAVFRGWARTILPGIGLVVATFGFIRKKTNEPNAMIFIGIGYCIAVLSLFL